MNTPERADVILENETMKYSHADIQSEYISYLHILDEEREKILLDFIVEYMILINNEQKSASTLNIDGRLINKIYLLFCYKQGITIPFVLGADPAYDPLLFSKLKEFHSACGFHPGLEFTRSILVDKKKLKELKENLHQMEREVDTILDLHFRWNLGVTGLREFIYRIVSSLEKKTEKDQLAKAIDQELIDGLLDSMKLVPLLVS